MSCIEKLSHTCGSSDGLQVFAGEDGKVTGFCFPCGTYVPDPYGEGVSLNDMPEKKKLVKSTEEIERELSDIESYPVMDLPDRKFKKRLLNLFGVKVSVSERDGKTPAVRYYPYTWDGKLVRFKAKACYSKATWSISASKDVDLFNWENAKASGARVLVIAEGEDDAMAIEKIFRSKQRPGNERFTPAVVSIPNGAAGASRDISKVLGKINKYFKEVVLCFDDDDPGHKAVADVCKVLPHAKSVTLPCKDANDCLIQGKEDEVFRKLSFDKEKPKNSKLIWLDDVWEKAKEPPEWGVSWPWEALTQGTRGIRKGETYYIGAGVKMGKGEIRNSIINHVTQAHGWKSLVASPEESNQKTAKMLAGKAASTKFHDPKVEFSARKFSEAGEKLLGKQICLLNLYQHMGWESLKQDIFEAKQFGIDAVWIDPITNLTNGMGASEANEKLQEIAQEVSHMALDLDLAIFLFCHLKNPDGGPSHDRGGKILSSQFAGSRAMARSCNYMFGLEGNKDPELTPEENNTRKLVCLEDREFGENFQAELYWDSNTTQFNEVL